MCRAAGGEGLRKGQAMTAEQTTEAAGCGKAMVRELLIGPLVALGLGRGRVSAADHEARMRLLAAQLAYMSAENLMTLFEVVRDNAPNGVWPDVWVVQKWAAALQPRPAEQARVIGSWLSCIEGPKAEAGGYLVELYRFLVRVRRPPSEFDLRKLHDEAAENARQMELVEGRIERGTARDEDHRWRAQYREDQRAARAIVDAGRATREAAEGQA